MTTTELAQHLAAGSPLQLLDVRLADDFAAAHLTGAANNAVFEVAFRDRLPDTAADKAATTVIVGATAESHEAAMAAEKLTRLGYTDVHVLAGGHAAARGAGLPLTYGQPLPDAPDPPHGTLAVDLEESRVEWLGRNLINKHHGTVALSDGSLTFDQGTLTGGSFTLDLNRLECADLAGNPAHDVLVAHLHDDDFFDVPNHPHAHLEITAVRPSDTPSPGAPNLTVDADLTLRGQTHPISFQAAAGLTPDGKPAAQAAFSIDRTRWGVLYGSGKRFHRLAGHLVNDHLEFQVRILTA